MNTVSFIGAGKMASALIGGLIKAGHPADYLWASCPTQKNLDQLKIRFGIHTTLENSLAASKADILILAVKPHLIQSVLTELRSIIATQKPLIISVAAGITTAVMQTTLGDSIGIIRSMPNTPALICRGITVLYAPSKISLNARQQAEAIFQAVGKVLWVEDEQQIFAVTALSGSGPAYFFLLMEALEQAGVALGLDRNIVHQLVTQTAIGSAYMRSEGTASCAELRQQVTSKGGGTERAVGVLESGKFVQLLEEAVIAAKARYEEMSN